jgi:hypothetical protein
VAWYLRFELTSTLSRILRRNLTCLADWPAQFVLGVRM